MTGSGAPRRRPRDRAGGLGPAFRADDTAGRGPPRLREALLLAHLRGRPAQRPRRRLPPEQRDQDGRGVAPLLHRVAPCGLDEIPPGTVGGRAGRRKVALARLDDGSFRPEADTGWRSPGRTAVRLRSLTTRQAGV